MENAAVYISLEQSTLVPSRNVHIGDIATIFCINKDISCGVTKIPVCVFSNTEQDQMVVSVMKLIELISTHYKDVSVISIGCPETIVYYRNLKPTTKRSGLLKSLFLMLIAFFGTAYSIMSYNGDVASDVLLDKLYYLFTGTTAAHAGNAPVLGVLAYSVGLGVGMIIFFNHGMCKNSITDPTPLQVQMRLYEKQVNDSIIIDSSRKNKTLDVD